MVYSQDGRELSRFHTRYSRIHRPIRWRSSMEVQMEHILLSPLGLRSGAVDDLDVDVADIVVSGAHMIYSGHGEPVAELVVEGDDRLFMAIVCDLTGDGYDDIIAAGGTAAYLYRNPRVAPPDPELPLGSGVNVTLY